MAGNEQDLARDIGTNLQERLPVEQTLPDTFVTLLADLDAAETRQAQGNAKVQLTEAMPLGRSVSSWRS